MATGREGAALEDRALAALEALLGRDAVAPPRADGWPAVARPADPSAVGAVLRLACEHGLKVAPGGAAGPSQFTGLLLDLSGLSQVRELNPPDMLAVVGAGVGVADLAERAAAVKLDYPPALLAGPGETAGGGLARGGGRGLRHGAARDYVLGSRAVLASGELVELGSRAIKNQTGYNLTQLLVGSWGALGAIVEATLRLVPRGGARRTLAAGFADCRAAAEAAVSLARLAVPPLAAEFLDRPALAASGAGAPLTDLRGAVVMLVLVDGQSEGEAAGQVDEPTRGEAAFGARLEQMASRLRSDGALAVEPLAEADASAGWTVRRQARAPLIGGAPAAVLGLGLPLGAAARLAGEIGQLAARRHVEVAVSGGAGRLELAFRGALSGAATGLAFAREVAALVRAVGGSVNATDFHLSLDDWLGLTLEADAAEGLRRLKGALDPHDVLRPLAL